MSNQRLNDIVNELGQYFGVRSQIVLQGAEQNDRTLIDLNQSTDSGSNDFLKLLMSKSTTAPSSKVIIEQAVKQSNIPLLITPSETSIDGFKSSSVSNKKDKNLTKQGTSDGKEDFYTMADLFDAQDLPNITVFQNFSPVNSAGTIDTDIVSLYMKSASSLEMSRAVPYLEIGIAGAVSTVDGDGTNVDKTKNYTFLGRFLGASDGKAPTDSDLLFYNADTDPLNKNPRFDPIDALQKDGRTLTIIGGMESFTAPQTMVNANRTHAESRGAVIDQFQPFMSLMSLRLSVVGQGGLMSFKSGNLELMLHDRARLNEIGSLIAPDRFGNTRLIITYGWSHPDGNSIARNSGSEIINNKIGELIDSMRVTETYLISNSKFSFEESSVKISISIAMLGGKTLREMDVSMALGDDLSRQIEQLKEELNNLSNLLNELNRERSQNKITTISAPTFLRSPESIATANQESLVKAIKELRSAFGTNSATSDLKTSLGKLFGTTLNAASQGKGGFSNNSQGDVVKLVQSFSGQIDAYIEKLKKLPDPFLPTTLAPDASKPLDKSKYVSLGKILTCFLGNAFKKQFDNSVDMQIFFHPFNHEAGRLHDYNVSQFYFEWDDFKNILKSQYSPFGKMTFGKLFNIIQQYFINDLGGAAYDFLNDGQRSTFARDPKNLTKRGQEKGKNSTKAYEQALESNRGAKLKKAYYNNEQDIRPAGFRLPQLSIDLQSIPIRNDWNESTLSNPNDNGPSTVIRLHVMDRGCEGLYTASELIRSSPGRTFSKIYRHPDANRNDTIYRSNHCKYNETPINILTERKFLKKLDDYLGSPKFEELLGDVPRENIEIVKNTIKESYLIFDASSYSVKDLIKGVFPSFDYGTLASGILKASVSSIDDSGLATIMLIRGGQGAKGTEGEENNALTVPMSVMPSSVSIDTIGCPYFSFAQFYFIDFGTNTNVDNVYAVTGIDHVIEPGKFQTTVKLTWSDSFAVFRPLDDAMKEAALKAILQRLGAFKNKQN
jgi:hypothetical protein